MALTDISNHITELNNNIQAYVTSTLEYYKLETFKNVTRGTAKLLKLLILGSLFLFCLGFVSIGFAIMIGNALDSLPIGFFIIGGFYFAIFLTFFFLRNRLIDKSLLKGLSKVFFNKSTVEAAVNQPLKTHIED